MWADGDRRCSLTGIVIILGATYYHDVFHPLDERHELIVKMNNMAISAVYAYCEPWIQSADPMVNMSLLTIDVDHR